MLGFKGCVQVDEFKHLKETLNKMPSLRQPAERQPPTVGLHTQPAGRDRIALPAQHQAAVARLAASEKLLYAQVQEQQRLAEEQKQRERDQQQHRDTELREQQLREDLHRFSPARGTHVHKYTSALHLHHMEAEVDPADDPNNQGEDEFEEAEQQVHEAEADEEPVPPGHPDRHSEHQHQPPADEQLVMAGNTDQQEDNLDEQYQEEGDDEAQDELAEEQKPEEIGEEEADPYNEENGEQVRLW
uniref:Golgi integral membrane protein 4-like n=1 Tax=Electrophorus electricus TaxID=8005 RepID=A0A4W4G3T0_ELEEL